MKTITIDCRDGVTLELAPIPAGTFMMGSPETEQWRNKDEVQHQVTISKPFYLGIYPVTQEQYQAVMGANRSRFKGGNLPVERVNWNDAMEFCQKLSGKTGRKVRLPTEAEWEYACRSGTKTAFNVGDALELDQANFTWEKKRTTPMGSYPANAFGLFDMHGNVWEWCSDRYGDYPKEAAIDPQGPRNGAYRVLRGGSWRHVASDCRSARRRRGLPDSRYDDDGFRVVVD